MSARSEGAAGQQALDAQLCVWAAILVLVAMVGRVSGTESAARYLIYVLPPAMILVATVASGGRPRLDRSSLGALVLFAVAAAFSLATGGGLGENAVRDILIIGGYLALFSLSFSGSARFADILLLTLVAGMALEAARDGVQMQVQLLESEGILESTLAFPLGALFIYYVLTNRPFRAFVTFIFFFLAFKRIALAAALAALLVYAAIRIFRLVRWERTIVMAIMVACTIVALFTMDIFVYLAGHVRDLNATAISLGRFGMARAIWEAVDPGSLPKLLFGHGIGQAHAVVTLAAGTDPHNDWLKIFFEYGVFGLLAFYVILAKVFFRNPIFTCIAIYVAILMVTDNTLIYMDFYASLFLLSRVSVRSAAPAPAPALPAPLPRRRAGSLLS